MKIIETIEIRGSNIFEASERKKNVRPKKRNSPKNYLSLEKGSLIDP